MNGRNRRKIREGRANILALSAISINYDGGPYFDEGEIIYRIGERRFFALLREGLVVLEAGRGFRVHPIRTIFYVEAIKEI